MTKVMLASHGGDGLVVSVLTLDSGKPSLNPAVAYSFYVKICLKER